MQTVLITGATSFVGAHLCLAFRDAGWKVVAARSKQDGAYSGIQADRLAAISDDTTPAVFDVTHAGEVADAAQQFAPDVWIHHAGYATDHTSVNFELTRGLAVNAGSIPPLFNALAGGSCGVIVTGTEAEYPIGESPRREDMAGTPRSLYGLSKLAETIAAEQFSALTGVATRVARLFLPVGLLDHPGKLLPQVISALRAGEPIALSECCQERDILTVEDVAAAYVFLACDLVRGGFDTVNVASGEARKLSDLLCELAVHMGADISLLKFGAISMRVGEPRRIVADITKIQNRGWKPTVNFLPRLAQLHSQSSVGSALDMQKEKPSSYHVPGTQTGNFGRQ